MNERKVRIQSDRPLALSVTDAQTGERIPNVCSVTFRAEAGTISTAMIVTRAPHVDLIAEAQIVGRAEDTPADRMFALLFDDSLIEQLADRAHGSWMESNRANGGRTAISRLTGEEQMVPYADLSERVKEYDREMVRGVINNLREIASGL